MQALIHQSRDTLTTGMRASERDAPPVLFRVCPALSVLVTVRAVGLGTAVICIAAIIAIAVISIFGVFTEFVLRPGPPVSEMTTRVQGVLRSLDQPTKSILATSRLGASDACPGG